MQSEPFYVLRLPHMPGATFHPGDGGIGLKIVSKVDHDEFGRQIVSTRQLGQHFPVCEACLLFFGDTLIDQVSSDRPTWATLLLTFNSRFTDEKCARNRGAREMFVPE